MVADVTNYYQIQVYENGYHLGIRFFLFCMRLWSLHPKYLDSKGLVALWRESLLAKNVLEGNTRGYINHPQLIRFKEMKCPLDAINEYLVYVYEESVERGYIFDKQKIDWDYKPQRIVVSSMQLEFEFSHLLMKLKKRDILKYNELINFKVIESHPIFDVEDGIIASWEKI